MRSVCRQIRSDSLISFHPRLIFPYSNRNVLLEESRFCLCAHDVRRMVRHRKDEGRLEFAVRRETVFTKRVMIWGGMSLSNRTPLNAQRYINAGPQTAAVKLHFLQDSHIHTFSSSARSLIEHILMGTRMNPCDLSNELTIS